MAAARDHQRIPSLDGLRAVSIGLVLVGHIVPTLHLAPIFEATFNLSALGVRVFFVISGFLITQLLIDEHARTGGISLTRFYFRRTMRIFPPYYAFLIAIVVLRHYGYVEAPSPTVMHAATYTSNIAASTWTVGHSWSLSVEEQFYLVWPALMILLGPRRWMWGAGAMLIASPLLRVFVPSAFHRLDLVADSLAAGCVLAGLHPRLLADAHLSRLIRPAWTIGVSVTIVTAIELVARRPSLVPVWIFQLTCISVQNLLIAFIVHWSIRHHDSAVGKVLNSAPIAFVGTISYSIYVWQQPFMNPFVSSWLTTFPVNLAATFACAVASFYWIERPSLALRKKLDSRFSPRRQERTIRQHYVTGREGYEGR